jgi:AcrR family transcriptional regulator
MILRDVGGGGSEGGVTALMPHAEPTTGALRGQTAATDERSEEPAPERSMRRIPAGERRAIRADRILDAAGQLIAERGYEAMSTSHIARHAGCSQGVLYQLFADKRAVVRALSARNLDRYIARLNEAIGGSDVSDRERGVDLAVDVFVQMCREDPGFRTVRFGDVVDVHLLDPDGDNDSILATRLTELMEGGLGVAADARLYTAVVMAIKIADGLLRLAFARDAGGDQAVVDHTKALLHAHFELALGEQGPSPTA